MEESAVVRYREAVYKINPVNYTYIYPTHTLPMGDYSRLIDLEEFYFQMMDNVCNDSSLFLLILVHSAPGNFQKRKIIRDTWGQPREGLKVIFMLGETSDEILAERLEKENDEYRDFAQGNFVDTYRNMTYKHVMVLKYVIYHCPQAKYILKTDDDAFVNIETMLYFLKEDLSSNGVSDLLLCKVVQGANVFRSYRSKWRVSVKEFPERTYPTYCPGFAILYSPDIVFNLYRIAQNTNYFWIDDVHVTGTLAKQANVTHTDISQFILEGKDLRCILDGQDSNKQYLYGPVNLNDNDIVALWNVVLRSENKKFRYFIR
ncbi:Galactosyltransferase [Popillia japonica]